MGLEAIRKQLGLSMQCGYPTSQKDADIEQMVSGLQSKWDTYQKSRTDADFPCAELDNMYTAFWHSFRSVKMMLPVLVEERNKTIAGISFHNEHALISKTALEAFFNQFK